MSQSHQPAPPSASAVFAGQLATMIVTTAEERDAFARQVATLQQQVTELQRKLDTPNEQLNAAIEVAVAEAAAESKGNAVVQAAAESRFNGRGARKGGQNERL
jgi:alkanesulfonate monooxygenase SsuD/methylene tetrahydromethanopterin reductase-like flavin-dependent oxidoreductase (luciferase family)